MHIMYNVTVNVTCTGLFDALHCCVKIWGVTLSLDMDVNGCLAHSSIQFSLLQGGGTS